MSGQYKGENKCHGHGIISRWKAGIVDVVISVIILHEVNNTVLIVFSLNLLWCA